MNATASTRNPRVLMVSSFAVLVTMLGCLVWSPPMAAATDDRVEPSIRMSEPAMVVEPIAVMMELDRYVELVVLDCAGTGTCTPQGWADFTVTDGDVTYFGISQANGFMGPIGPFHADAVAISQGYHEIEAEPLVHCGERYLNPATSEFTGLNDTAWVDLTLDSGLFIYQGFDAPLLTCYVVSNEA